MSTTTYGAGGIDRHTEYIQTALRGESYNKTKAYSLAKAMNWVQPMPIGLSQVIETKVRKMSAGTMHFGTEEAFLEAKVSFDKKTYDVMLLGKTFPFGRREKQAWVNSSTRIGKGTTLEEVTINEWKQRFFGQLDGFVAWGTNMRQALAEDKWHATNTITGIFNGFSTESGGGAGGGEDDNMYVAYDYMATIQNFIDDLEDPDVPSSDPGAYEADQYIVLSSPATLRDAQTGTNHKISSGSNFITEHQAVLQMPEVYKWIKSPNFLDYAKTANRIAVIPLIPGAMITPDPANEQQIQRSTPFSIYQEPIQVYRPYGGQPDKRGRTYVTVYTALAWAQTNVGAIVRSGDLTFTEA